MADNDDRLELRYVPLQQVQLWDRNAKLHNIGDLAASIQKYGFRDPPAFDITLNDGSGGIVAGNGRIEVLAMLHQQGQPRPRGILADSTGGWLVPILFGLDAPSQAIAMAYAVDHNNLTMSGGPFTDLDMSRMWDSEGYIAILQDLASDQQIPLTIDTSAFDSLIDIMATGYAAPTDSGASSPAGAASGPDLTIYDDGDESIEPGTLPGRAAVGDCWQIGRHYLIVGDNSDPATVDRLLAGVSVDLVLTDPNYGIAASSMTMGAGESAKPKTDRLSYGHDWDNTRSSVAWLLAVGTYSCIWGGNYFADQLPISNDWLIWHKRNDGRSFSECEQAWTNYGKNTRFLSHHWNEQKLHITQKPLAVFVWCILQCPGAAPVVFDPYAGSGTSILAAEKTDRTCYAVERDPRYADIAIKRAESFGLACTKIE